MVHLVVEANYEDFKTWAIQNAIHPFIIGFLGFRPDLLSSEIPASSETNPAFATPRTWTMLSTILQSVETIETILPTLYGTVGYAAGIEFSAFVKVYKTLPDSEAILSGESEEVPKEPSALYALCSALIEKYSQLEEAEHLLNYAYHLPVEFAVMLVKDLITKDEAIASVEAFDGWMETYGDYIV
jgi:hypothetical protein